MVTFNGINHQSTKTLTMGRQYNLSRFVDNMYTVRNNLGQDEEIASRYFTPDYCAGDRDNENQ